MIATAARIYVMYSTIFSGLSSASAQATNVAADAIVIGWLTARDHDDLLIKMSEQVGRARSIRETGKVRSGRLIKEEQARQEDQLIQGTCGCGASMK